MIWLVFPQEGKASSFLPEAAFQSTEGWLRLVIGVREWDP